MLVIKHWNTWAACLEKQLGNEYWKYIWKQAQEADIFHLFEVHSCTDPAIPDYVNPEDAGHRAGPLYVRQFQKIEHLLRDTHDVYFQPQINGLHDLDGSHPTIQYGNVTAISKSLSHTLKGGMCYRQFNELNDQEIGGTPAAKSIQSVLVFKGGKGYQSVGVHGHWDNRGKIDTPERDNQFQAVMDFAQAHRDENTDPIVTYPHLIVGGDLNITSQCNILRKMCMMRPFPKKGGVILNEAFQEWETRTSWYPSDKPHREANFVLVDPALGVTYFSADTSSPSDHTLLTSVIN